MNIDILKLVERLRDGKDRLFLTEDGNIKVESNEEVIPKDKLPYDIYELLREHAEATAEQQSLIARLFPHLKGGSNA